MAEVFVSYARANETVAKRVTEALRSRGFNAWSDQQLPAHRAYGDVIEQRLRSADAVVVLWSKAAVQSQWVRAEADFARTHSKLVQAQLDSSLPPLPFNQIQCANLKGWRGDPKHAGWTKLLESVAAVAAGEGVGPAVSGAGSGRRPLGRPMLAVLALAFVAIVGVVAFWIFQPAAQRPTTLAVLPFKSLEARDESLVAGMWEDTRQALSRNPQLVVLGPNSSAELATKDAKTASNAADYLLQANVRTSGDRIRVTANLVRSRDGAQIWSETFARRLDDVFRLQMDIARQIEGRIRGRLAEGGGVMPENIATSGEVYAIYSDGRAKIRSRERAVYGQAILQLRRAVEMDPNFAPGWATLAVAERIAHPSQVEESRSDQAETFARRAIALAPNLAAGHAALAMALHLNGPVAEAELRRAVALDPNDFEGLNWLAGMASSKGDQDEALKLYSKVSEIEPLWWPASLNKLNFLLERGDYEGANQELERVKKLGSESLATQVGMEIARFKGDLSTAADLGLAYYRRDPDEDRGQVHFALWGVLLQLGYSEEVDPIGQPPPFGPPLRHNDPRGLAIVEALNIPPKKFFAMYPLPMAAGRVYLLTGRAGKFAEWYHKAASSPEELAVVSGSPDAFVMLGPFLALALQSAGDQTEASRVLAAAGRLLKGQPHTRVAERQAALARIRAVQGRDDEALSLLTAAINGGWLPVPPAMLPDIALDPALAKLSGDPRFHSLRERILGHLRKERAELGPLNLHRENPRSASETKKRLPSTS